MPCTTPFRKIARQPAPLAAALEQIKNGAEHLVQVHGARPGFLAGILQKFSDWLKLCTTDAAGVRFSHAPYFLPSQQILNRFLYAKNKWMAATIMAEIFEMVVMIFSDIGNLRPCADDAAEVPCRG
jgi:hypothetical protein